MMVKSSSRIRTIKPTTLNSITSSNASISSTSRRMMLRKTLSVPAINTHKTEVALGRVRSTTTGGRQQLQQQHKGQDEAHAPVTMKLDDTWNEVADMLFKTKGKGDYDGNDGSDSSLGRSSRHGGSKGGGRRMLRRGRSDSSSDPLGTASAHTSTSGSRTRKPDPPSTTTTDSRSHSSDAKRSTEGTRSSSSGRKPSHQAAISLPFLDDALSPPFNETRDRSQSPDRSRTRSQSRSHRSTALSASAHNTRPRTSSKDSTRKSRDPALRGCSNETENTASSTPSTMSSTSTTTSTSRKQRTLTPTRSSGTVLRRTRSNDMECRLMLDNEEPTVTKKQTLGSSISALSTPARSSGARIRRTRSNDLECLSLGKEERATRKPTGRTSTRPRSRSNDVVVDVNMDCDTGASGGKDIVTSHNSIAGEGKELSERSSSGQAYSMSASATALKEFEDAVASSGPRSLGMSVSVGGKMRKGATTDLLGSRSEHHQNRQRSRSKSNGPRNRATRPRSLDPTAKAKERRSRRNASEVDDAEDDGGADPPGPPPTEHPSLKSSAPHGVRTGNPRMSLSRAKSMSRLH
jgi:hypothetical protein